MSSRSQLALLTVLAFLALGLQAVVFAALGLDVRRTAVALAAEVCAVLGVRWAATRLKPRALPAPPAAEASNAEQTLRIASQTLPIMRQGFNAQTAGKAAEIIKKISEVAAVAITDNARVLAFVGTGCEHHRPGDPIMTEATRRALSTGELQIVTNQRDFNCVRRDCPCPLEAAVIVPLKIERRVVGALKLYQTQNGALPPHLVKLAVGLGQLLSTQVEMAELDRQAQLATKAELDALRAQINPHFFFNILNTIIMYTRVDPEKTRRLLLRLAEFFRQALKTPGHFQTVRDELAYLRTYLYLERNRFKDKLRVRLSVDPSVLGEQIPVLIVQPLVENAVKHGIGPKLGPGTVEVTIRRQPRGGLLLRVTDDGVGMNSERLRSVLEPGVGSGNGVGLSNVYERLTRLYGDGLQFRIESALGRGTTVTIGFDPRHVERSLTVDGA
ncbi:MAG TPA: histidine kinase [Firmicutes bacterium]|nr:histidine kinase [Bacillota bacterium]